MTSTIDNLIQHYSCINRLQRGVAWILRFKDYCKYKFLKAGSPSKTGPLTPSEIADATQVILQRVQYETFKAELDRLKNNQPVKKNSRLTALNPVI